MGLFFHDLRVAVRVLLKEPLFVTAAVVTLALGIGVNSTVFSLINGFLLRPFPFERPERLVALQEVNLENGDTISVSYPNFVDWRERSSTFETMAAFKISDFNLAGTQQPERVAGARVSAHLFETLGMSPMMGRGFDPSDDRPGAGGMVILSHSLWQRLFGSDPQVLSRTLRLNGVSRQIIGVMPAGFKFPMQSEIWVPLALDPTQEARQRHSYLAVARLADGVSLEQARQNLQGIAGQLREEYPDVNADIGVKVVLLRDFYVANLRPVLMVLALAVGLALLIVCANVANLILSRAVARQNELAIRGAMGASRPQLIWGMLAESLVIAILGGLVGLVFTKLAIGVIVRSITAELPFWLVFELDARVTAFTAVTSVLASIVAGLFPALRSSRAALREGLSEGSRAVAGGWRQRRLAAALVVFEVGVSMALVVCAMLAVGSFRNLQEIDPGFDPQNLLTAEVSSLSEVEYDEPSKVEFFYRLVLERLERLPGVEAAVAVLRPPLSEGGTYETGYILRKDRGEDGVQSRSANFQIVTPRYLQVLKIPLLQGRDFEARDRADAPQVAIINRMMAESLFPEQSPLGQEISVASDEYTRGAWRTIVGVVENVRGSALDQDPSFEIYIPHAQAPSPDMALIVRYSQGQESLTGALRREVYAVDPEQPVSNVQTMETLVARSLTGERFTARLIGVLGVLALVLAAIGLFGVISYTVNQRRYEIGVRMALGARKLQVRGMVLRQSAVLVGIGISIGLPIAIGLNVLLASVIYGISKVEIGVIAGAAFLFIAVSTIASLLPALRASNVDPMIILRTG